MSAREYRARRWQRWNTRPAQRSLASRPRRARFTSDELTATIDVSMKAGEMQGWKRGERNAYEFLAELLDDPIELTARIGAYVLPGQVQDYLDEQLLRQAREANPEKFARLAEMIRAHDNGEIPYEQFRDELAALTREVRPDLWPSDGVQPADVIGEQERADEEASWWSGPPPVDLVAAPADDLLDVAEAVGATPLDGGDPAGLVAQIEAFLTCPPWCATNHADPDELRSEGMTDLRQHLRTVATVERDGKKVATVDIVACDNLETGERTPAEVMIVECRDSYSADEAEAIAAAMLEAARIVRDGN
ncbi:DUF6907 domain-containing protein [Micromonospora carbonacea]|uniref:DUF6907 domain-containing protein n=1 Tax=Micromonospora carbonacea TaxID=47853 RepID=UPI003721F792